MLGDISGNGQTTLVTRFPAATRKRRKTIFPIAERKRVAGAESLAGRNVAPGNLWWSAVGRRQRNMKNTFAVSREITNSGGSVFLPFSSWLSIFPRGKSGLAELATAPAPFTLNVGPRATK